MSAKLMDAIFGLSLPPVDKLVLLALADHAKNDGPRCFPSIARVAEKTSLTRRGVQKIMRRHEREGRLLRVGGRPNGVIEYRIVFLPGGEPDSRGEHGSQRTGKHSGANGSARGGERGSPETSLTTKNDQRKPCAAASAAPGRPSPSPPEGPPPRQTDPRFRLVVEAIRKSWPEGVPFSFDAAEGKALNDLLVRRPNWSADQLVKCVTVRFASEGVNPAEAPRSWLRALTDYASGPRDRFNRLLKKDGNGRRPSGAYHSGDPTRTYDREPDLVVNVP